MPGIGDGRRSSSFAPAGRRLSSDARMARIGFAAVGRLPAAAPAQQTRHSDAADGSEHGTHESFQIVRIGYSGR